MHRTLSPQRKHLIVLRLWDCCLDKSNTKSRNLLSSLEKPSAHCIQPSSPYQFPGWKQLAKSLHHLEGVARGLQHPELWVHPWGVAWGQTIQHCSRMQNSVVRVTTLLSSSFPFFSCCDQGGENQFLNSASLAIPAQENTGGEQPGVDI